MESDGDERREIKTCAVCGDHALGYNFNAVTCESCKAFFRRNALKSKAFQCPFKGTCRITALTRRFCQKCRLDKCYKVGMKPELIMTEAEKERKRRKIMANRAKLEKKGSETSAPNVDLPSSQTGSTKTVEVQTEFEAHTCSCRWTNQMSPNPSPLFYQESGQPKPNAWPLQSFNGYDSVCSPLDATLQNLLDDLTMANRALEAPLDQEMADLPPDEFEKFTSKSLLDVINLTALAIRRLIKMCKKISGFKVLCQEDQLTLLKQGCTQMMLLRSVVTFDPDKNTWKIPHTEDRLSQIKVEVLKQAQGNIYEAHENFLRTFDPRASHDMNVMCILTAVALFEPNKAQLVDRNLVIRHQEMYYNLLRRYLLSVHPSQTAVDIYHHLIMKMIELRQLNEDHVRVYLEVNPSQVEPILIEIFDLKPH